MARNGQGQAPTNPKDELDVITIWRGRDSATYSAKEWEKLGDKAKPLWVRQYPGVNEPFHKIELKDVDGFMKHRQLTKDDIKLAPKGEWNVKVLKRLLNPPKSKALKGKKQ